MDKVFFHEMMFYAYHGVYPEESRLGQRFTVDLELGLDLRPAAESDDLAKTVNYQAVYETVRSTVEGKPVKLVETLAERVIEQLFAKFPVEYAWVRITKPDPPIPGHYRAVGVEMRRERNRRDE
ncbi:MAG: dihydroneopterin aldolase [Novibacillus thermophilus]|uniref:7,8-dihydroneopterin aldolase n=1 Tax=Novibacillus thermophilus TaxID=1471761 RepID=A0A1U9K369_9BACL|nr:dihydroneopterin aldolase [Novibacillus thermophilus]AQS54484.1 dihydroneopterin aldolase [Novibacillus thermophilus]